MFKFRFSGDKEDEEEDKDIKNSTLNWISASKVEVLEMQVEKQYEPVDYAENKIFPGCKLKLIRFEKALHDLQMENCTNIIEAESQNSDLIPAKYEGGLKIWECNYDLSQYLFKNDVEFQGKLVLDLGCGNGVLGLIALLKNSIVHFQDYNVEVIKAITIPNVLLNFDDRESVLKRCQFFCGDWESFTKLRSSKGDEFVKYDLILTSDTTYNPDNLKKLYEVFKQRLKEDGIGLIAGKSYYFGVGGGIRQFQNLIEEDGIFDVETMWKTRDGLEKKILKITRKQQS
ncbi:histidine protein methyltransferase 1 homolog isoform X2 [Frieseomelitta varia]|uniref:histidine protein methyltransferase 1 homolog isoform X2 n=1 Tax=Frieseomelitta varia TaxID=561572 RepID=UPI001CB69FEB|nr:histidine protein methyltransferase 1 homolog isoform X2 [Frieseomelitta varia]